MKRKIIFSALAFLFLISGFIYLNPSSNGTVSTTSVPPPPSPDKFYYGAIQSLWDQPNYNNYDAIGLNLTHAYIGGDSGFYPGNPNRHTPSDWISPNVHLFTPVSVYAGDLQYQKQLMYQHNQSRFFYHRPKIEWLAFGQSSTYEAEPISTTDPLWFYSFNVHNGVREQDNQHGGGHYVLHCSDASSGAYPGDVLKKLKANTEQCKRGEGSGSESQWRCDSECDWLVKPRIRIPASYPVTNPETPVCRITVLEQDGHTIKKEFIIKAKYFKDPQTSQYDGSYIEEFNFLGEGDQKFTGDLGDWWSLSARGNRTNEQGYNLADIQVYWYDNCEMWIDYVKVENDVANDLLADPPNPNTLQYNQWIHDEAVVASEDPAVYKFYIEIVEFNNLPCIKHINDRLREVNSQVDLVVDFDPCMGAFRACAVPGAADC